MVFQVKVGENISGKKKKRKLSLQLYKGNSQRAGNNIELARTTLNVSRSYLLLISYTFFMFSGYRRRRRSEQEIYYKSVGLGDDNKKVHRT